MKSRNRVIVYTLQWHHNEHDGVSNYQPHNYLLNRYSSTDERKHRSSALMAFVKKTSNAENVSIWWRHEIAVTLLHALMVTLISICSMFFLLFKILLHVLRKLERKLSFCGFFISWYIIYHVTYVVYINPLCTLREINMLIWLSRIAMKLDRCIDSNGAVAPCQISGRADNFKPISVFVGVVWVGHHSSHVN